MKFRKALHAIHTNIRNLGIAKLGNYYLQAKTSSTYRGLWACK